MMLNGTSSVLYGTVPDLTVADRTERAFALFYTGVIGSGALSPLLFGVLGDHAGPIVATMATAVTALAILPRRSRSAGSSAERRAWSDP